MVEITTSSKIRARGRSRTGAKRLPRNRKSSSITHRDQQTAHGIGNHGELNDGRTIDGTTELVLYSPTSSTTARTATRTRQLNAHPRKQERVELANARARQVIGPVIHRLEKHRAAQFEPTPSSSLDSSSTGTSPTRSNEPVISTTRPETALRELGTSKPGLRARCIELGLQHE